jgi:DNA-3-methyladenine glycosylase II
MSYRPPTFEALARSIVFQQLNGKAASTIYDRFASACGKQGVTPESVLKLRLAKLRAAGLSAQKSAYIKDLAKRTSTGDVDFSRLHKLDDHEVIEHLTQVKGVGVWTAHMFLMFALKRPDILPTGDFGVRLAMKKLYVLDEMPKPEQMEKIAEPWRPFRSAASWYLWRSLEGPVIL